MAVTIVRAVRTGASDAQRSQSLEAVRYSVRSTPARAVVRLTPVADPAAAVELNMLGAATLDPGNPRWAEVNRPRRSSVLRLDGWNPTRQSFQVMFSGRPYRDGDLADVTDQVSALHRLIGGAGDRRPEPAVVRLAGPVYGIGPEDFWQVEAITPGEPWRRTADQRIAQVTYGVTLVQHFATDLVTNVQLPASPAQASNDRAAATSPAPAPAGGGRTYTVRRGDSLSAIAARELGNAGRWREIAQLSGVRDPNRIYPGQVLRLP